MSMPFAMLNCIQAPYTHGTLGMLINLVFQKTLMCLSWILQTKCKYWGGNVFNWFKVSFRVYLGCRFGFLRGIVRVSFRVSLGCRFGFL
jgi:hypothetical protein